MKIIWILYGLYYYLIQFTFFHVSGVKFEDIHAKEARTIYLDQLLESKIEDIVHSVQPVVSDPSVINTGRRILLESAAVTRRPTVAPTLQPANLPWYEIEALYSFWNSTGGRYWHYENNSYLGIPWDFDEVPVNPCYNSWQGVICSCNRTSCTIISLVLSYHNLSGTLPPEIGNFTNLEMFEVRANALRGPIPLTFYEKLTRLTVLNIFSNGFSGTLPPSIENLSDLTTMDIASNSFTGTIPENFYNLTRLRTLYLGFNYFSGTISAKLQYLHELQSYRIKNNNFTSQFPFNALEFLGNLSLIDISNNSFTGQLPNPFGANCCKKLLGINLGQNLFTGKIPEFELSTLSHHLLLASFNRNFLSGTIPSSLTGMTSLEWYSIERNNITGQIPLEIDRLHNLTALLLNQNYLTGEVTMLQEMTQIQIIDLHQNMFYGQPYTIFLHYQDLIYFTINNNLFSGLSPAAEHSFVNWTNLVFYLTYDNGFTGSVPFLPTKLLRDYEVGNNFITGSIPEDLLLVPLLTYLHFEENLITGTIPSIGTTAEHSYLYEFYGYSNFLTSTLPIFLTNITRLLNVQVYSNSLTGTIPVEFFLLPHLQTFFLQYNYFEGSLLIKENITSQLLTSIDISHNSLTGPLPFPIFNSKIETFAACSNCFDGSLSSEICAGTGLTVLALDGLSTASACREPLFPSDVFDNEFTSFILTKSLSGEIPSCLFELPNIQTLHLSGNGLKGTLLSSLNLSESLNDLSLSHNFLTGTIPMNFQNKTWSSFDLSNNKFTGILSTNIMGDSNVTDATLHLYVNHFSGTIPSKLLSMENINILQGNLFSCDSSMTVVDNNRNVPSNDPSAATYDCGSNLTNDSLYVYLLLTSIVTVVISSIYLCTRFHQFILLKNKMLRIREQINKWKEMLLKERLKSANISSTIYQLQSIRMIVFRITMFIVLILLPMYGGLSSFASTYRFKYAWTISSAFLSGKSPGIVLFVVYFVYLMFCYLQLDFCFSRNNKQPEKDRGKEDDEEKEEGSSEKHEGDAEPLDRATAIEAASSSEKNTAEDKKEVEEKQGAQGSASNKKEKAAVGWNHYLVWFFVALIDIVLMVLVNILYVVAVVNPITINFIVFLQLILAIFKVIWNDYILWKLIPAMRYSTKAIYSKYYRRCTNDNKSISIPKEKTQDFLFQLFHTDYSLLSSDLIFILVLILFNNSIAPFFSIAIIAPDCFYYAFFQAPSVDSSYSYCDYYLVIGRGTLSRCMSESIVYTTYTPPYSYSYQCSSELPVNYSPVYIYMFIFLGFLQPMSKILMKWIYDGIWERYLLTHRPSSRIDMAGASTKTVQSPASDAAPVTSSLSSSLEEGSAVERERSRWESQQYNQLKKENRLFRFLDELLPEHMKQLKTFEEFQFLFVQRKQQQQRSSLFFLSFSGPSTVSPPSPSAIDKGLKEEKIRSKSKNSSHANERNNSLQKHVLIHTQNIEILRMKRLFVKLFSYVGILLSFGTLFPPLAVIICISIFLIVSLEELMIGRVLYESQERGWAYHWYEEQIHYECNSFQHKLISMHISWVYMILMCLIFSYILFDTIGNESNWQGAIIPTAVFFCIPLILWTYRCTMKYIDLYYRSKKSEKKELDKLEERDGIELSQSFTMNLQEANAFRVSHVSFHHPVISSIQSPYSSSTTNMNIQQHIHEIKQLQTLSSTENPLLSTEDFLTFQIPSNSSNQLSKD